MQARRLRSQWLFLFLFFLFLFFWAQFPHELPRRVGVGHHL